MDWWIVAMIGIQVGFVSFIAWLVMSHRHKRKAQLADERLRLLERFESGKDFADFLESEPGRDFLASFQSPGTHPLALWTVSLYSGIVSLSLGLGFLFLANLDGVRKADGFLVPAVLLCAAGLAVLLAGFLTRSAKRD